MMFLEFICVANECFVLFGSGRVQAECFWYLDVVLHVFVNMNNQHVSKQTACFISGSCRMFSWWVLMFSTFLQQVQMKLEMGMRQLRWIHMSWIHLLQLEAFTGWKDAWFASCRCLLQEGTARQEEAQHSMLHENCMCPSFVFLCGKGIRVLAVKLPGRLGFSFARHTLDEE